MMISNLKNIAIVPARGGSKRIKNKNIVDFHGRPIITYVLHSLIKSKLFEEIHVSTDSEEIKKVVEQFGLKVKFLRPKNLSDDMTGIVPVLHWVLEAYKSQGMHFDNVCCALPTAALLDFTDFTKSYDLFIRNNRNNPLHAITKMPVPIEWSFRMNSEGLLEPTMPEMLKKRSQDLKDAYYDAGAFSWFSIDYFNSEANQNQIFKSYLLDRWKSVDIDNLEDLIFAEKLYKKIED